MQNRLVGGQLANEKRRAALRKEKKKLQECMWERERRKLSRLWASVIRMVILLTKVRNWRGSSIWEKAMEIHGLLLFKSWWHGCAGQISSTAVLGAGGSMRLGIEGCGRDWLNAHLFHFSLWVTGRGHFPAFLALFSALWPVWPWNRGRSEAHCSQDHPGNMHCSLSFSFPAICTTEREIYGEGSATPEKPISQKHLQEQKLF